jgi:type IV pilus assembly protein PilZ
MIETPKPTGARQGMLSLAIRDRNALYAAYMPFLKNGGLFVPTGNRYSLGDEVFILLSLMEDAEKIPVVGRVVWITPKGAQGNRTAGVGLQFADKDGGAARVKIEAYLVGTLGSERPTHTM